MQFVALFMLAFMLFDVCTPEPCEAEIIPTQQSRNVVQAQDLAHGSDGCQFEQDCFNCASFAAGGTFDFHPVASATFTVSELFVPPLDGTPLIPYHPPRA